MGTRVVNGNTFTEDGWPLVDQAGCTWITIAGTNPPVNIEVQSGIPASVLGMWVADLNAFVEKVRDADTASWTESNSVLGGYGQNNGSNHLGGTAVDVDWDDHPMGPAYAGYTQEEINEIRAMREFYKLDDGTYLVWWAEDWDTPKDSMHFQLNYNTYEKRDLIQKWIDTHSTPDGFSTYRRGAVPAPPTPTPSVTTDRDKAIKALYDAVPVIEMDRAAELVDSVMSGLALSGCNTVNRIAMWLAQIGYESDGFNATAEYGKGAGEDYAPYYGRTWIQITWQGNYAKFGAWAKANGLVDDANIFVNNPDSLADIKWAGIGAAWYWTVERPTINSMCDNGDLLGVTKAINGGTNGLTGVENSRTDRYNQAINVGNELLDLVSKAAPIPDPIPTEGDYVPTQEEWNALVDDVKEIRAQISGGWPQNGMDAIALAQLDDRIKRGDNPTLNDMVAWIKAVQMGLLTVNATVTNPTLRKGKK